MVNYIGVKVKIVINKCFGGFSLSRKALQELKSCNNKPVEEFKFSGVCIARDNPNLIRIVEQLGSEANGSYAELAIIENPDDVKWEIMEHNGKEWVYEAEQHRIWTEHFCNLQLDEEQLNDMIDDCIEEIQIKNKLFDDMLFLIEIQEEINAPY